MLQISRRRPLVWMTAVVLFLATNAAARTDELDAFPAAVHLEGKDARQQLLVSAKLKSGTLQDVTRTATYRIADPNLAILPAAGVVQPLASGKTHIDVS